MNKCIKFEIIKPVLLTWEELYLILNEHLYNSSKMANYVVQKSWEWDNYRIDFKNEKGVYPDNKDKPNVYKMLREKFPNACSYIINQTKQYVEEKYKEDRKDIFSLKKSIPSYRKNLGILFQNNSYSLSFFDDSCYINLPLRLHCGRDKLLIKVGDRHRRAIVNKLIDGEYKKGMIQIVKEQNKWYIILYYSFEPLKKREGTGLCKFFISNNPDSPLVFKSNDKEINIPFSNIVHTINKFSARINQLKEQKKFFSSVGHGRKKLNKPITQLYKKIDNYKKSANHNLSKIIVQMALKSNCSTLEFYGDKFIFEWNITDLKNKIKYKTVENGITFLDKKNDI